MSSLIKKSPPYSHNLPILAEKMGVLLIIVLFIGLVLVNTNPLDSLPERDSGSFLYAGRQILQGGLPYVDFWDSKPPGIFYINAFGLWLGANTRWGVWVIEFFFLTLSSLFMYRGVEQKWGRGAALFSSILWLYGFYKVFESGNLTEEYSLLFNFWVLSYFLKLDGKPNNKLSFLIGFTLSLSFLFRANNIGVQISILLTLFFIAISQKKILDFLKKGLISFTGISLPIVFVSIYFWSQGILEKMFNAAIAYNFYYSGKEVENASIGTGFANIGWPAYIALLGYGFLLIQLIFSKKKKPLNAIYLFLLISLPTEIMLSNISGRALPHYFILWMPSIAAWGAFTYASFSEKLFPEKLTRIFQHPYLPIKLLLPILLIMYFITGSLATYKNIATHFLLQRDRGIEKTGVLASFIRDNTTKEERILVWGADPSIYFLSNRSATTPYIFYPLFVNSPFTEKMSAEFYDQLVTYRPKYIIDTTIKTPDAFSLNKEKRDVQQETDIFYYEPPYQEKVLHFIDLNYQFLETIGENDIYMLK